MDHYTLLERSEIEAIARKFGIRGIHSFKLLSGGSENTNYLIKSEQGDVVLCICEQKSPEKARELAFLLEHLEKNQFVTSKIQRSTEDKCIILWENKPAMVKQYIEGKIQKELSPDLLNLIGEEMAKLHQIPPPPFLPAQPEIGKEDFGEVKKYAANSEFDNWLGDILNYMEPYFVMDLPKALIHGDLFWDNIIISEDEKSATLMDFEESSYYYRVFDIGMMIIGICGEGKTIDFEKAAFLLQGYQKEIQLSKKEQTALKAFTVYAGATMTFWRHINFNYTKPDPKFYDHYKSLKVLTDFVLAQPDDCFIKLMD